MIGGGLGAVEGVAAFAVGAGDEHCSHALVREQTVEAARGARLVIRMSVHGEKSQLFHLQSSKEISLIAGCHITAPGTLVVLDAK